MADTHHRVKTILIPQVIAVGNVYIRNIFIGNQFSVK